MNRRRLLEELAGFGPWLGLLVGASEELADRVSAHDKLPDYLKHGVLVEQFGDSIRGPIVVEAHVPLEDLADRKLVEQGRVCRERVAHAARPRRRIALSRMKRRISSSVRLVRAASSSALER